MNRRDFFNSCKIAALSTFASPLLINADEEFEANEEIYPIDSLVIGSTPIKKSDIFIEDNDINEFISVRKKLKLVQRHIGYGNFNVVSFDELIKYAKYAKDIGEFTSKELNFLEKIFYINPTQYGFYGKKISDSITERISEKDIIKIPKTGHYLFRGKPEQTYYEMKKDIGDTIILTSGVRSIVKQMNLYLNKIYSTDGNITEASKSLAPPAFTYHSIGDFDVGKIGLGYDNFTSRFALTDEFVKMKRLTYIEMRYTINNKDGVRYEPWHIKVI